MPEPIKYQADGIPFKPGQLFDPAVNNDISGLTNVPGQSLADTNTPEQIANVQAGGNGIVSSSTDYRTGIADLGDSITSLATNFDIEKPNTDFDAELGDITQGIED